MIKIKLKNKILKFNHINLGLLLNNNEHMNFIENVY